MGARGGGRPKITQNPQKLSIRRIHMKFHLFSIHLKFPSYVIFATSGEICEADSQLRRLPSLRRFALPFPQPAQFHTIFFFCFSLIEPPSSLGAARILTSEKAQPAKARRQVESIATRPPPATTLHVSRRAGPGPAASSGGCGSHGSSGQHFFFFDIISCHRQQDS